MRWQRSLYRFSEDVEVRLEDRSLTLSGRAGTIQLDLTKLDPSGLVAFKMLQLPGSGGSAKPRNMLALATPDKALSNTFTAELDASVRGVTVGYLVGVTVKGVGYRCVGGACIDGGGGILGHTLEEACIDRGGGKLAHPRCARFPPEKIWTFCLFAHPPRGRHHPPLEGEQCLTLLHPFSLRIEPMVEKPAKRSWYFEDDLADRSAIVYPHPQPVPAVRLKVRMHG